MFQRWALIFLAVLTAINTGAARAASLQTISPSQCVWHAGDNAAWSAPSVDESNWKSLASWKVAPDQSWMWVRCHADLSALRQANQPALQVNEARAYQLFLNGKLLGQHGNLSNGQTSMNSEQTFSVDPLDIVPGSQTSSMRIRVRRIVQAPMISAGEAEWLRDRHRSEALAGAVSYLPVALGFGVIGVLGFVLLGLYLNDRSHLELLLLACCCWSLATIRMCELCEHAMVPMPAWAWFTLYGLGQLLIVAEIWFMFRLAGRKVPLLYKVLVGIALVWALGGLIDAFASAQIDLWWSFQMAKLGWVFLALAAIASTAAFVAFWPWRSIPKPMRAMAGCAMLWGLMDLAWFSVRAPLLLFSGRTLSMEWWKIILELRLLGTLSAIIALVALLFREQRRTAQDRAVLAGEMQAAQQIQRILAPAAVDTAAGAHVEVAFRPMRDVGGDFYLCRVLADGRQRVLVGDVSGKGAAAAMTATLLIGAAERRDEDSPAELLRHLNLVLYASRVGGFATCLCADLEPGGQVTLANAGHLPPYLHGEEIALAPGLPLGLSSSDGIYEERRLHLGEEETLTFLSDGVVEARSATGELFGFERTKAMSAQKADAIAEAAEKYGQQDDITVLTLTRARTPAAELSTTAIPEMA